MAAATKARPEPAAADEKEDRLIDVREVARRLACDKRTVWRGVKAGKIPSPVKQAPGQMTRWKKSIIDLYIATLS